MDEITLIHGDCLEEMTKLKPNSIDTIITDPPYGLGFMNKEWDNPDKERELIKREKKRSEERFREGKSPTTAPFTQCVRPGLAITGAKEALWFQEWTEQWAKEALRISKPGATLLCFGGSRMFHRITCGIENAGWQIRDCIMWLYGSGFPKATDISKQLDKKKDTKFSDSFTRRAGPTGNKQCKKCGKWLQSGSPCQCPRPQDEPTTPQAKLWNGWKSHGLKPAYEPIIVAMKPNEGSYAENALKHGVAGLNIDQARIGTEKISVHGYKGQGNFGVGGKASYSKREGSENTKPIYTEVKGRFPANIILDEEAAKMLDEQSGVKLSSGKYKKQGKWKNTGKGKIRSWDIGYDKLNKYAGDSGGASRFFYIAKASKTERNMGCGELEPKQVAYGNQQTAQLKRGEKLTPNAGVGESGVIAPSRNHHPTVKPLKLMEYLCRLTKTPTGGVVLDPFMGSGTTGMACKITKRKFIGIEKEKEYYEIAKKRIRATMGRLF